MSAFSAILDIVYPNTCVACRQIIELQTPSESEAFCATCLEHSNPLLLSTEAHFQGSCLLCSEPNVPAHASLCTRCTQRRPIFARAYAPYSHEGPIARAIFNYKYDDHPELARPLGQELVRSAADFLKDAPALVVPIPLHRSRCLERMYDQAALLAKEIANVTHRDLNTRLLERLRPTQRQVGLSELERAENVANAFVARRSLPASTDILLVDDVYTTGSTANAAAEALLRAGARSIWVLTLARANRGNESFRRAL